MWWILVAGDCRAWFFLRWFKKKKKDLMRWRTHVALNSLQQSPRTNQGTRDQSPSLTPSDGSAFTVGNCTVLENVLFVTSQKALIPLPDYQLRPPVANLLLLTSYLCLPPNTRKPFKKASADEKKKRKDKICCFLCVFFLYQNIRFCSWIQAEINYKK